MGLAMGVLPYCGQCVTLTIIFFLTSWFSFVSRSSILLTALSSMLLTRDGLCTWGAFTSYIPLTPYFILHSSFYILAQRIPFWKSTMADSSTSFKKSMTSTYSQSHIHNIVTVYVTESTRHSTRPRVFGMSIVWLMTWSLTPWRQREDLYGHARTTMVMYNQMP